MPALVAGIHAYSFREGQGVDDRAEPGHDEMGAEMSVANEPGERGNTSLEAIIAQ
jgi:hypothetical protein